MAEGLYEEPSFRGNAGRRSSTALCGESADVQSETLFCEKSADVGGEKTLVGKENADVESETLVGEEGADVESDTLVAEENPDAESETLVNTDSSSTQGLQLQLPRDAEQGEYFRQLPDEGFQRMRSWERQLIRRPWARRLVMRPWGPLTRQVLRRHWVQFTLFVVFGAMLATVIYYLLDIKHDHSHNQPQPTLANLDEDFTAMSMKVERK